jgi:hypothetical protein
MTINARPVPGCLAGLLVLAATAALLGACGGPSRGTDSAFWRNLYGDPDTTRPDSVGSTCCRHAGRDSNH